MKFVWMVILLVGWGLMHGRGQAQDPKKQSQQEFMADVRQQYEKENFVSLDLAAYQARVSRERFPGAEWRLSVFYQTLLFPERGTQAGDPEWKLHLERLQKWVKTAPDSMTARVALGAAWAEYAKKAYTPVDAWTDFDRQVGGKAYQERLKQAERALTFDPGKLMDGFLRRLKNEVTLQGHTALKSHCPHWYVVRLRIEQRRTWDWDRFNTIFGEGAAVEPAYYPLYLIKAAELMPQNHGGKQEWERFADTVSRSVEGNEGAILYYLIVAQARSFYNNAMGRENFFQENHLSLPRILESYKILEATYGTTYGRLNEMALLASLAKESSLARSFFDRMENNYDAWVWQERAIHDAYRNLAYAKGKPKEAAGWMGGSYGSGAHAPGMSGLQATISTSASAYVKSEEVVVDVLVENPTSDTKAVNTYELSYPALSLLIINVKDGKSELTMPPQAGEARPILKPLKPGESMRFSYRLGFSLPPGEYKLKMRSLPSNEPVMRIGKLPVAAKTR